MENLLLLSLDSAAHYANNGEIDIALEICNEVIKKDPKLGIAYHRRGLIYAKQRHHTSYNKALEDFDVARDLFDEHTSIELYYHRSLVAISLKYYRIASVDLDMFLDCAKDPSFIASAYNNRGFVYVSRALQEGTDFWSDALHAFNDAIHTNPKSYVPYYNRAHVLVQLKHYMDAIESFKEANERRDAQVSEENQDILYLCLD